MRPKLQIRYVEAFNEPDHNLAKSLTPAGLYDYYKVYCEAVNELNRELQPQVPLELGGPGYMQYNETWMYAFLDRYAAGAQVTSGGTARQLAWSARPRLYRAGLKGSCHSHQHLGSSPG